MERLVTEIKQKKNVLQQTIISTVIDNLYHLTPAKKNSRKYKVNEW